MGKRRREAPPTRSRDLPCFCWRLDLPHGHTVGECADRPR